MKTLTFKTNINCGNCIKSVTPHLNNVAGIIGWKVDTDDADKILTVESETATSENIKQAVEKAGFKIEARQ